MPSTDTHRPGAGPAQVLSLGDATAIIVGLIVGAGIFKTSSMVAGFLLLRYFVVFSNITTTALPSLSWMVTVSLPTAVTMPMR